MTKVIVPVERIATKIFLIRKHKVMIDRDLAELYGVETRVLNQAVRRNIDRFPDDFLFKLNREEIMNLSQIVISSKIKHAPNVFAFTEQGVAMLSSVLNSKRAIEVNIQIMRAFVRLWEIALTNKELKAQIKKLESKFKDHDVKIQAIFTAIKQLMILPDKTTKKIGFK